MNRRRVAFVVQRAGVEVNGGAEYLCLSVARAMQARWDVTIITTTARDYMRWEEFYPAGESHIDGVQVLRFPVDHERSVSLFNELSDAILGRISTAGLEEQERWMRAQGPYSSALLRYIDDHRDEYDVFVFFTYLYATTYFGLPLVSEKALLAPFAHDEWPLRFPMWDRFMELPRRIIFSTPEERNFLRGRFPRAAMRGPTIGTGVEAPADVSEQRFRARYGAEGPYALYVGRVDASKGCDTLVRQFGEYVQGRTDGLQLVLLGRTVMQLPRASYLRPFGFVDEQTKFDALAGADVLIMPSALESLSIALLEAWSVERPVLVNAASDVLVGQCRRANGGLWYADDAEFDAALTLIRDEAGAALGASGARFVEANYRWRTIEDAYEAVVEETLAEPPIVAMRRATSL